MERFKSGQITIVFSFNPRPDLRNKKRNKYCLKPECRKASKTESQQKWLQKSKNRDYFRGSWNVLRVQEWRKAHPGYWRQKSKDGQDALQDLLNPQLHGNTKINSISQPVRYKIS
jgi:restriction endonuclease